MLAVAVEKTDGPVAVCYPRGGQGKYTSGWDHEDSCLLRSGDAVTIVSYGVLINQAEEAAELLAGEGISAEVIKLNTLAPLIPDRVLTSVKKTGCLVVAEECFHTGGIGQQLCQALLSAGVCPERVALCDCGDQFVDHGTVDQLRHSAGIDALGIAQCVREVCHGKSKA